MTFGSKARIMWILALSSSLRAGGFESAGSGVRPWRMVVAVEVLDGEDTGAVRGRVDTAGGGARRRAGRCGCLLLRC